MMGTVSYANVCLFAMRIVFEFGFVALFLLILEVFINLLGHRLLYFARNEITSLL